MPPAAGQPAPARGPRPYAEVITAKAESKQGLFTVHKVEDKYYFELADSLLGRDLLMVSRLAKAGVDMRSGSSMSGYAGDVLNQSVVRFEKGPNNKIFLRDLSFTERSGDSTKDMYTVVMNSNIQPIAQSFDVRSYNTDSVSGARSTVIEFTDLIASDNDLFFFGSSKSSFGIGAFQADKSYVVGIRTFPINTEIRTIKTYTRGGAAPGAIPTMSRGGSSGPVTVELNTSIVLLPKTPMQPRLADERVGYFTHGYTDFDANPQGVKRTSMIARWRLEPKDEDMEKYKRGELVEPKKPIIIYIDPATPAKWVPYLIAGVNDWQSAFEKAGFKNAIYARKAPTPQEDPSWSLEDARNSAIVYKPSSVANASGPHISDPRSGEIMETHINWYHNIMKLVHDWYFIQCAAVDTAARKMVFSDELMGQLIRFVSSHEVGHTLGLRHNFGASSATPVEKMRDKKWVEANGHTSSIMDYARFNYVAQPGDNIGAAGLFPRIGDYDKWAIEFGYRWLPNTVDEEAPILNKWIVEKLKEKKYWFGNEMDLSDPRAQSEDLGDNAMKASEYGIKNLKLIVANMKDWTATPNEGYDNLKTMYGQLISQLGRYIGHVTKNIGGRYETLKTMEQAGRVYEPVSKATQRQAVDFIKKQIFTTPTWLLNKEIIDLTGISPVSTISTLQESALDRMLRTVTLSKLLEAEVMYDSADVYRLTDYIKDLNQAILEEAYRQAPVSLYRRNLQRSYINKLINILMPPAAPAATSNPLLARSSGGGRSSDNNDVKAVVRANLSTLLPLLQRAGTVSADTMTRYHYQDLAVAVKNALAGKE